MEEYRALHDRAREILGSLYDEKQFDRVMGSFVHDDAALKAEVSRLEVELTNAESEEEKNDIRRDWLMENDALSGALEDEEEAAA